MRECSLGMDRLRRAPAVLCAVAVCGAALLAPTAIHASTVPEFGFLQIEQVRAGLNVSVAGPTAGDLTVATGGNLKQRKTKLLHAASQAYPGGPVTLRLRYTKGARAFIQSKGHYKVVLDATLVPSDGSTTLHTTRAVILKP